MVLKFHHFLHGIEWNCWILEILIFLNQIFRKKQVVGRAIYLSAYRRICVRVTRRCLPHFWEKYPQKKERGDFLFK